MPSSTEPLQSSSMPLHSSGAPCLMKGTQPVGLPPFAPAAHFFTPAPQMPGSAEKQ